ncbi:hypothetical protein ADL06_21695 [Streptomyces sp. NRRL F-6491]|nr:hypothetical protein ADL06_21695 [Streptomyces sp. NRRL F-6491]KOX40741.1 hypothetical protein ADL08_21180 [Streptomyces sp. NRRL F-6492]
MTTTDLDALFALAERLLVVAEGSDARAEFWVRVPGREQLRRLLAAVPGAETTARVRADAAEPGDHPLSEDLYLIDLAVPVQDAVETARAVLEFCPRFQLTWDSFGWPPVPELGHAAHFKYAAVQISFHHRHVALDEDPAPDHTLYVHADGHDDRAEWLARQAGAEVIGPPLEGP